MRHFPHWIKAYIDYTRASESPLAFHFWTGVSTLAGAVRRRVWRDEFIFKWTPNFYIILVAPAGVVSKSTSLELGMSLLRQVKPDIAFGPESLTWQALGEAFMDAMHYVKFSDDPLDPRQPFQMSALTIPVSELGTFLTIEDPKFVSFLTTMWDGREHPFLHRTRSQSLISIERPWLNIIGATTPSWIRNNIPEGMIGEGLMSRVIFVYGDTKRHLVAYPSRAIKSADHYDTERKLVEDLNEISQIVGGFSLTAEAEAWGEAWYAVHNRERPQHMASDRFAGYLARKQGHMHKLAMILSIAKSNNLIISKEDLFEADQILRDAENSMIKVFESIGVVDEARRVAELVSFVRTYKWIGAQDLYRLCHNIMSQRDFKDSMRVAVEGGMLRVEVKGGKPGLAIVGKHH